MKISSELTSNDIVSKVEELARQLTPLSEMAALTDIDEMQLRDEISTSGSPLRKAYFRGMAEQALKIRKRNLELADAGSPAADEAVRGYLRKMMYDL